MANLKLKNPSGGSLALVSADGASDLTVTFPAATGTAMVSGNMPAFSAYTATTQSISGNVFTKVSFPNERFDTNNNFASSTFTPTIAGYYQLNASMFYQSSPSGQAIAFIYKNGSAYTEIGRNVASGSGTLSGGCVVYANGSTDSFDVYFYSTGNNTLSNGIDSFYVNFSGSMVRSA